jgi:PAS domain S-box-containing protein
LKNSKATLPRLLLYGALLACFLVVVAGFFFLPYKIVRQNTLAGLNAQQSILARQAALGIEDFFTSYGKGLDHLASHPGMIRFDDEGRALMAEFFHANPTMVSAVTRIDAAGRILHTVPLQPQLHGVDLSSQPHNRLLIERHEQAVSSVFNTVQGYASIAYAVPVFDQGGYAGSLSLLIPFAALAEKYLSTITLGADGYAWLLNRDGVELYCPVPGHVGRTIYQTSSRFPSVLHMAEKMMAGEAGQATYSYDQVKEKRVAKVVKQAVYHPIRLPHNLWSIVVATPEKQALASIRHFGRWWLGLFLFFVTGLLIFAFFVFRVRLKIVEERERAGAAKRRAESRELLGKLINASHVPIAMVNINGTIEFLNEKCVELYGYTLADIPTMDAWFGKVYPDEGLRRLIVKSWRNRLEDARQQHFSVPPEERAIVCADGSRKEVEFAYTLVEDRVIVTLNDKTESNRLARERQELEQRREKTKKMEALGLLAGGVAHDLNNILSGLVSYPELLLLQLPPENPMRGSLELIRQSGRQAAAVVADLLTVARGVASVKKPENLNRLISEYRHSPEGQTLVASHPRLDWVMDLGPDPATISCSAVHVKKCLMNLMTNGAEATPGQGRIVVATRTETVTPEQAATHNLAAGDYVVLSVADSGGGIAERDQEHIFEPFYTKKEMGRSGSGLGLTVVWNTMQDHGGAVIVTSTRQGTTFELYFPVCHEEVAAPAEEVALPALMGHGEKILVVDDQAAQRDIACQFLRHLGYQCHAVASGEEACDYLATQAVDLVVLDMIMGPGMDGSQTYAALVRQKPGQKAIIASGFSEDESVRAAQRLGAGDFIRKPYSIRRLGLAVQQTLAR